MSFLQGMVQNFAQVLKFGLGDESRLIQHLRPYYEDVLCYLSRESGMSWQINGVPFRIHPAVRSQMPHTYDPEVSEFIKSRIQPGSTCLNIGANVGVHVLQLSHWTGSNGRVFAFEPNPHALRFLHRHIRMNSLELNVEVIAAAVGNHQGECDLYTFGTDGRARIGFANPELTSQCETVKVPILTIDEFCNSQRITPSWIVMDIEGFEIAALQGACRTIERSRGNIQIIAEMHPDIWELSGANREDAERLFSQLRLKPVPMTDQGDPLSNYGIVFLEPY